MKVLVTCTEGAMDAPVDPRFGRAAFFLIYDQSSEEWQAYPNNGVNASGGAGVKAAQFSENHKVDAVISGHFGPNAFEALQAADIKMFASGDCQTAAESLQRLADGQLKPVHAAVRGGFNRRG
jgi:predicted Fe-Mo cluster-binding NifX family protein